MVLAAAHRWTTVAGAATRPALVVVPPSRLITVALLRPVVTGGRPLPVLLLVAGGHPLLWLLMAVVQHLLADGLNQERKVQQAVKGIMVEAVVLDRPLTRPLLRIPQG
jgi:hypothetical protein